MDTEYPQNLITRVGEKVENGGRDRTDTGAGLVNPDPNWNPRHENFRPLSRRRKRQRRCVCSWILAEDVDVGVRVLRRRTSEPLFEESSPPSTMNSSLWF